MKLTVSEAFALSGAPLFPEIKQLVYRDGHWLGIYEEEPYYSYDKVTRNFILHPNIMYEAVEDLGPIPLPDEVLNHAAVRARMYPSAW